MSTIVRLRYGRICMYLHDHNPPHFHMRGPGYDACIRLDDFQVIAGLIDRRAYDEACDWVAQNRREVEDIWDELQKR